MLLNEIPFITHVPQDGRKIMLLPWHTTDVVCWHMYAPIAPENFIRMQVVNVSSGIYLAESPAATSDLEFPLATLVVQHLSFPTVLPSLNCIVDDLHLLSASLAKIELVKKFETNKGVASFLIESELEYQFTLVRSMYDVMQKMVKRVAKLLHTEDKKAMFAELPDSFATMALDGDRVRNEDELVAKYALAKPIAAFYFVHSRRFQQFRSIRVDIEHHGKRLPTVFETGRGFGISTRGSSSWSDLEVWKQHELLPNDIGSVRALSGFLARSIIDVLNDFNSAFLAVIPVNALPPAVSKGYRVFLTNPLIGQLSKLDAIAASPWN